MIQITESQWGTIWCVLSIVSCAVWIGVLFYPDEINYGMRNIPGALQPVILNPDDYPESGDYSDAPLFVVGYYCIGDERIPVYDTSPPYINLYQWVDSVEVAP